MMSNKINSKVPNKWRAKVTPSELHLDNGTGLQFTNKGKKMNRATTRITVNKIAELLVTKFPTYLDDKTAFYIEKNDLISLREKQVKIEHFLTTLKSNGIQLTTPITYITYKFGMFQYAIDHAPTSELFEKVVSDHGVSILKKV